MFERLLCCLFCASAMSALSAADKILPPQAMPGAINHLEVPYLDGVRLTGDDRYRKDHQLTVDIHIPRDGKAKHPCIISVHGGGFGGGDKNGKPSLFMTGGVKAGFVMVDANYILNPKTLPPQVYYDIRDLVRFLRINAEKYQIDPDAIGLAGFSAGGWLNTGAWFLNGDYISTEMRNGMRYDDYLGLKKKNRLKGPKSPFEKKRERQVGAAYHFLRNPEPHYPDVSASVQALSQDFAYYGDIRAVVCEVPAVNSWCGLGKGGKPRAQQGYIADKDIYFSTSQVTPEKYWGKGVHVPNFETEALLFDNTTKVQLWERVLEFFTRSLVTDRRVPNPEIHPGMRVIDAATPVRLLTTSPDIVVHYTTDGSKPDTSSPTYSGPFNVEPGTTVKAIAVRGDERASQVVQGTFWKGTPPPKVSAPDVDELPPAAVGKPYRVQFEADGTAAYWYLGGEFCNTKDGKGLNGLSLDEKGVLSGAPKNGGRYWLQVHVARERLGIATLRNYRLVIAGRGRGTAAGVG